MLPRTGDVAPDFRLPATSGEQISPRDFYGEPVLLVFLEQLGSLFVREHLAGLARHRTRLDEIPAAVLIVSFAPLERLKEFARDLALPFPCLSDTDLSVYEAYGLRKLDAAPTLTFRKVAAVSLSIVRSRRMPRHEGDPFQLGGDFVVSREGRLRLAHRMADLPDRPRDSDLLGLLNQVAWIGRLE